MRLANNVRKRAAALWTTGRRHDAIGAAIVAAALHRDPRFHPRQTPRPEVLVMLSRVKCRFDAPITSARAVDQCRQRTIAIGTDDKAHMGRTSEQVRPKPL